MKKVLLFVALLLPAAVSAQVGGMERFGFGAGGGIVFSNIWREHQEWEYDETEEEMVYKYRYHLPRIAGGRFYGEVNFRLLDPDLYSTNLRLALQPSYSFFRRADDPRYHKYYALTALADVNWDSGVFLGLGTGMSKYYHGAGGIGTTPVYVVFAGVMEPEEHMVKITLEFRIDKWARSYLGLSLGFQLSALSE